MSSALESFDRTRLDAAVAAGQPVLLDFSADWCQPCRMLAPTIESLATSWAGRATIATVDVDSQPDLAREFGVQSIPTVVVLQDGNEVARFVGVQSESQFDEALQAVAGSA